MAKTKNWTFLTNHGVVFLHLAEHPGDTIRLVSDHLDLSERAVAGMIADLRIAGYLSAEKRGVQNVYSLNAGLSMRHATVADHPVSELLTALSGRRRLRPRQTS